MNGPGDLDLGAISISMENKSIGMDGTVQRVLESKQLRELEPWEAGKRHLLLGRRFHRHLEIQFSH